VRLFDGISASARRRRLVAARADLGARADAEPVATVGSAGSPLGDGPVILRVTLKTAELVGETPAEWQLLEKQVRAGRWTSGLRTDVGRLRPLAAELEVTLREEGVVPWRRRPRRTSQA